MSHIHLEMKNLSFSYEKGNPVLEDISFSAKEHESIGIIGANGAGKTTLLRIFLGLHEGYTGDVRVEDMPVTKRLYPKIREKVGYVFQDSESQLFMPSVYEELAFGPRNYGFSGEEIEKRVEEALEKLHIRHLRERKIYQLSGGEKKLTAIAAVLTMRPDILLLDEPSAALDSASRRNLIAILKEFHHLKIIASHDLDLIRCVCGRVIFMEHGRIIADAETETMLQNETFMLQHGL